MTVTPGQSSHSQLVALLARQSLKLGEFTLASGRTSRYYIDARPTTMSAKGLEVIGRLGVDIISRAGWSPSLVGGLTLGADPVAYAIAVASRQSPPELNAFVVRKESKDHGTGRRIEGCFAPGAAVVVVEDVITSGGSAMEAIRAVEDAGGCVVGVLAVVDRLEGGRDSIEGGGYSVETMVTIRDLGVDPESPETT